MSELLNPYEVLSIAQTIEENGARFYRAAVALHPEPSATDFLLRLAEMEEDHKRQFAEMQKTVSHQSSKKETDEEFLAGIDLYLKAIVDSEDLEGTRFAQYLFTGAETLSDIVMIGIDLEKETILYYLGLKDLMQSEKEKNIVNAIINEEKSHIATLAAEFQKIKAQEKV